jgi:hypothetical protein
MNANVMPIETARRLTPDEFKRRREEIKATYGENRQQAGARFEQALARLFYESGWTQDQLAAAEGKSKTHIDRMCRFGRFLSFPPVGGNTAIPPANLTERRFRGYWEQTDKAESNERIRFRDVLRLIEEETRVGKPPVKKTAVGEAIVEKFADGHWHELATIVKGVAATEQDVSVVLDGMEKSGTYRCHCERRPKGKTTQFRIIKGGGLKVDMDVLLKEVRPILQDLKAEVKKSYAVYSPNALQLLIHRFEQALESLAKPSS